MGAGDEDMADARDRIQQAERDVNTYRSVLEQKQALAAAEAAEAAAAAVTKFRMQTFDDPLRPSVIIHERMDGIEEDKKPPKPKQKK
eukprot:COSAG04_NODE_30602_length_261_cov_1.543210_1_plen_86_part_11